MSRREEMYHRNLFCIYDSTDRETAEEKKMI